MAVWKITETLSELTDLYYSENTNETAQIMNMKSESRKKEYMAVRLLLRQLMQKNVLIGYHGNGAPYLINDKSKISISHTRDYAAILLNEETTPGIDIEYRSSRAWKLRERFLSNDELKFIENEDIATVFWCAKETVFKVLQQENPDFIQHFTILAFPGVEKTDVLKIREQKTESRRIFTVNYNITDNYILTWTK